MKKSLYLIITIIMMLGSTKISAQVKIGDNTNTVNPGSLLELESSNKGLLLPRLVDTTSISNPPQGMFMFNNTDTSLYFRRLGGWRRLSTGSDDYWAQSSLGGIYTKKTVTINNPDNSTFINEYAPFQTRGMFGNTMATFGNGLVDNTQGISLIANWPGVFFNSYYNNGISTMAGGNTGNITLDQSNTIGGAFLFNFTGYAPGANTSLPNGGGQMILNNDGKLSLNTGSVPTRAWFEQHGAVNNACAIFGGEGAGVSIQEHFPAIGFNSYYNGSGYNCIGRGYGGEIGIDQNDGNFYVTTMNNEPIFANNPFTGFVRSFNIARTGNVGLNTTTPISQLEIVQPDNSLSTSNGLTFSTYYNYGSGNVYNNINLSTYVGVMDGDTFEEPYLVFQERTNNGAPSIMSSIGSNGEYHQLSDRSLKKDIISLDQNNMLQKLLLLKPSNYHFISENEKTPKSFGFIAQDVEQLFPEFVNTIKDKKMLAYSSFIPVIVAAIQEQQKEIEALKMQKNSTSPSTQKENEELKNQVSTLMDMVKQFQC